MTASSLTAALLLAGNEGCLSVVHIGAAQLGAKPISRSRNFAFVGRERQQKYSQGFDFVICSVLTFEFDGAAGADLDADAESRIGGRGLRLRSAERTTIHGRSQRRDWKEEQRRRRRVSRYSCCMA